MKDFLDLEATYLGVLANPLGLAIAEPESGKFQVEAFLREADYLNAGGSTDAAGVYLIKDRVMLVPLASLGLTPGSSGYKKTRDFDPRTLIHETTHALTHQWLGHAPRCRSSKASPSTSRRFPTATDGSSSVATARGCSN